MKQITKRGQNNGYLSCPHQTTFNQTEAEYSCPSKSSVQNCMLEGNKGLTKYLLP